MIGTESTSLAVRGDAAGLARLSQQPGVLWIAPLVLPQAANDVATGQINAPAAWTAGYAGQDQVIDIADTGVDTGVDQAGVADIHADLNDRGQEIASWPISSLWSAYYSNAGADDGAADLGSGHGTHVAGSAVGNGAASSGLRSGVAPQAGWTAQALEQWGIAADASATTGYALLGVPADLNDLYQQAYDWGARVSTNSWTYTGTAGAYTTSSRQIDQFVWEHPDMVVVFAAGNDGQDANSDGVVDLGSIAAPATAKNVIAVGATENLRPSYTPPVGLRSYGQLYSSRFTANPLRDDAMGDAGLSGLAALAAAAPPKTAAWDPVGGAGHLYCLGALLADLSDGLGRHRCELHVRRRHQHEHPLRGRRRGAGAPVVPRSQPRPQRRPGQGDPVQAATDIPGQYAAPYNEAGAIPNNNEGWGAVNLATATAADRRYIDETPTCSPARWPPSHSAATAAAQPALPWPGAITRPRWRRACNWSTTWTWRW